MIEQGQRYRHFRNHQTYRIVALAKFESNQQPAVVYEAEYDDHGIWIRPLDDFCAVVNHEGKDVPRFELLTGDR